MHLWGFILHGWSCYYNDGEVVKKNILPGAVITIKTFKRAIKIAYGAGPIVEDSGKNHRVKVKLTATAQVNILSADCADFTD